jgi:hypothetical protein
MRKFFFILLILILSFNFISSAEIEIKEEMLKGETLIAKISGNFVQPLTEENIYFYRRHMSTSMGVYDLIKIQEEYYLYVNIPLEKVPDNYSIVIKDSTYKIGTQTVTDDFFGNFTILDEEVPFTLNPGILITNETYFIEIQNLEPNTIVVEYKQIVYGIQPLIQGGSFFENLFGLFEEGMGGEEIEINYISLLSGQEKTIEIFSQNYLGFQEVEFNYENSSYPVLAWIDNFIFDPENETVLNNETIVEENITENLEEEETFWDLLFGKDEEENITEEEIIPNQNDLENCEELGGQICLEGFKCENETIYAKDAKCCMAECVEIKESSTGKTIGWVIIIVIALFLTWFFKKKYKTKSKSVDLLKVGKNK